MKKKNLLSRTIIIVFVTLVGLYLVIGPRRRPTLHDFTWSGIKSTLRSNIHLGLDLQGGSHLVMRVKTEEYLKRLTSENYTAAQQAAKDANLQVKDGRAETGNGNYRVVLEAADAAKVNEIKEAVEKKIELADTSVWSYSASGAQMSWTMTSAAQRTLADNATTQALNIIDSRINALGIAEPTLQTHGAQSAHQILLQMPGEQNPERIKAILSGESRLELVHVVGPPSPAPPTTYMTEADALASLGGNVPPNRKILPYSERIESRTDSTDANQPKPKQWVVVEIPGVVDGSELRTANAVQSQAGGVRDFEINFSLKKAGAEKFGNWTTAHVNDYMGVVLNGEVKSVAFIKSPIYDSGQITGRFSQQSAEDLALTLRSGALPAPIEYIEERTVGPSLGQDSINAGVTASLVGLAMVVVFMLFYYKLTGFNAVVSIVVNLLILLGLMAAIPVTMTLPGVAGFILTIGMGVDSNVLIFERIKEELATARGARAAVNAGFDRVWWTIVDTHVSSLIAALLLLQFGTGPIRGFAVTLIIGLLSNVFTAVFVSRTMFELILSRRQQAQTLSI